MNSARVWWLTGESSFKSANYAFTIGVNSGSFEDTLNRIGLNCGNVFNSSGGIV